MAADETPVGPRQHQVGVLLLPNAPVAELLERARRVEEMGFDQLWVADHFVNPYAPSQDWFHGWTLLAAVAVSTSRIRIGPLVTNVTLHNPVVLSRMVLTVDHLSGGRLELGIGPGGAPLDYRMTGVGEWSPRERVDRLAEALEVVTSLIRDGSARHSGTYYQIDEAELHPRPVQQPYPPITIGALGPRAISLAARFADTWNTYGVALDRDIRGRLEHPAAVAATRQRGLILDEACERIGRDPASIRRSYLALHGYAEPILGPAAFLDFYRDLAAVGIDDVVMYWPGAAADEPALEALAVSALPELRR